MAAYTTIADVAARFPQFKRAGTLAVVTSSQRAGNVVTVTTQAAHGFLVGWSVSLAGTMPAGATTFDGTAAIAAVPSLTTFTFAQLAADDTATGGTATGAPANRISDGQIQNWIAQTADFIEAVALSRGYTLTGLSADASNILTNLNLLAAQIRLGEAIQANAGVNADWKLLDGIRSDYAALLKSFQKGDFDKNFLGAQAKTQDPGPQLGGFVPGAVPEPDNKYSVTPPNSVATFRRGQNL